MNNPFMDLSPAEIDVLDDLVDEWNDLDRYGQLKSDYGYGPKKSEALSQLSKLIASAGHSKVKYQNVEEMDD